MDKTREYTCVGNGLSKPYICINVMENLAGLYMGPHVHNCYHVNCAVEGRLTVGFGGKEHEVTAGNIFILPPNKPHYLKSDVGYLQIGINMISCDDERGLAREFEKALYEYDADGFAVIRHNLTVTPDVMRSVLKIPAKTELLRAQHYADEILIFATEYMQKGEYRSFGRAFDEMCAVTEPWRLSLSDMCKTLNLSRTQLERLASRTFGCGAVEYCARLRYKRICELLFTSQTLESIALQTGFCDASHLSKFFSSRAGTTPGKYRTDAGGI